MIFTLMKNRRLRLQVFVLWLVLGVGILPDKTSALKCYSCDGPECKTNFKATAKEANCTTGYCEKITDGDTLKMQCSSEVKEGECIKKEFPDGCYTFSVENKEKLTNCTGAADAGATAGKAGVQICSCDSDLCNNNGNGTGGNQTTVVKSVKCYQCSGKEKCAEGNKANWNTTSCNGGCINTRLNGASTEKDCGYSGLAASCYAEVGGCANPSADNYKQFELCRDKYVLTRFTSLAGREGSEGQGPPVGDAVTCHCDKDLCNFGERPGSSDKLIYLLGILAASYGILTRL